MKIAPLSGRQKRAIPDNQNPAQPTHRTGKVPLDKELNKVGLVGGPVSQPSPQGGFGPPLPVQLNVQLSAAFFVCVLYPALFPFAHPG